MSIISFKNLNLKMLHAPEIEADIKILNLELSMQMMTFILLCLHVYFYLNYSLDLTVSTISHYEA